MQRVWNKYGEKVFVFIIVERCVLEVLREREQYYLDIFKPYDNEVGYNIGLNSCGGDNLSMHPNIKEISIKRGKVISSSRLKLPIEERSKRYGRHGKDNGRWKGGPIFCLCGSTKAHNAKTCSKCRDKKGINNPFYGKHHTEKTKATIRRKKIGKYAGFQNKPFTIDGVYYKSLSEASKTLSIPSVTIHWRLKCSKLKFSNYQYYTEISAFTAGCDM